ASPGDVEPGLYFQLRRVAFYAQHYLAPAGDAGAVRRADVQRWTGDGLVAATGDRFCAFDYGVDLLPARLAGGLNDEQTPASGHSRLGDDSPGPARPNSESDFQLRLFPKPPPRPTAATPV